MFACEKSTVKLNLPLLKEKVTFFQSNFTFQILILTASAYKGIFNGQTEF